VSEVGHALQITVPRALDSYRSLQLALSVLADAAREQRARHR
jgi:ribosomal protein S2